MANMNQQFSEMKRWFLGTFGIIVSAFKIPLRNPSFILLMIAFIILTLIAFFPLFFMTFVPRLPYNYRPTLIMEAFDLLQSLAEHSNPLISDMAGYLPLTIEILGLCLFHFVSFLIAVTTIYAASTIYTSSERSKPGLLILLRNSAAKIRSTSMFPFLYVSFLDGLSLYALFYWIYAKPLLPLRCPNRYYRAMNSVVSGLVYAKWVDYRAWWNLSIVVSILEDKSGLEAMSASSELTKGKRLRGFILMLLYSVLTSKLPTLLEEWTFPRVFVHYFLHSSFICLGKVMSWVVLTVNYYDCKITFLLH